MNRIDKRDVVAFWNAAAEKTELNSKEAVGMLTEGNEYYARARTMEEFTLLDVLVSKNNGNILEIGCGSGRYAPYFAKRGISYLGVDISSGMIALAKSIYGDKSPLIDFRCINDISDLEGEFDCIIIGGVTQYLNDDELFSFIAKCIDLTTGPIITRDTLSLKLRKTISDKEYSVIYRTPQELDRMFFNSSLELLTRQESYKIKLLSSKVNILYARFPRIFKLLYVTHRLFLLIYKPLRHLFVSILSSDYRAYGEKKHMFSVYEKR